MGCFLKAFHHWAVAYSVFPKSYYFLYEETEAYRDKKKSMRKARERAQWAECILHRGNSLLNTEWSLDHVQVWDPLQKIQ